MKTRISHHPVPWVLVAFATGLLIGGSIGGGIALDTQEQLDDTKSDLRATNSQLSASRDKLSDANAQMTRVEDRLEAATAKARVPSFIGEDVTEAEDAIETLGTDWKVRTVRKISGKDPGTVIAQSPREGKTLTRGRTVTLTVTRKAPPSWKTVFTFNGSGQRTSDEFDIPPGKARIAYSFTGDTNAILDISRPDEDDFESDNLLNEIGDYSDSTRIYNREGENILKVEGGTWSIRVEVFR